MRNAQKSARRIKGELLTLLRDRVPPGVDEAAYVKAGFLKELPKVK